MKAQPKEKDQLVQASRHLSENELKAYTNKFVKGNNQKFSLNQYEPLLSATNFNNTLFLKGFLLNTSKATHRLTLTDSLTTDLYYRYKSYHRRLAAEYAKPIAERQNVDTLEARANTLEKNSSVP